MDRPKGTTPPANSAAPAPAPPAAPAKAEAAAPDWRQAWQLPALLLAGALFVGGIAVAMRNKPQVDQTSALGDVERLIAAEQYRPALELLNEKVRPYVESGGAAKDVAARFHLGRARAIYLGQKAEQISVAVNHENVVAEFLSAEKAGAELEARDQYFLADTYISLNRFERAMDRLEQLPPTERIRRGQLLRRMVELRLGVKSPDVAATLGLLVEFLKDPGLTISDRAWALARQAELLIRQGYADEAIAKLLRSMPGMLAADAEQVGELYLLLGRAYLEGHAASNAAKALDQAVAYLPELDTKRGMALVLLARLDAASSTGLEDARAKFASVVDQYAATPAKLPALLGLAETEAALGNQTGAVEAYGRLVSEMSSGVRDPEITPEIVGTSLLDRFSDRFAAGDTEPALRFAGLAEQAYPPSAVPAQVLDALGSAHRRAAEEILAEVGIQGPKLVDLERLDPATREMARVHFVAAADYYRRHAAEVIDSDNDAYGRSLWLAADSFDMAGDQGEAIPLFAEYAAGFPDDPRRPEAVFRLAQAHQARGDMETASKLYAGLLDGTIGQAGPFADASYVPLARALLADPDPENDPEAMRLLRTVVDGRIGGTDSRYYRDALVQLAGLHYKHGDYATAIGLYREAVARFPDDPEADGLRFNLADAFRLDAAAITRSLQQPLPDDKRRALEETRVARLSEAMELFEQVRFSIEARDSRRLTDLDRLQLRNSTFYVADCAFELGRFEEAIRRYDAARERYPRDPASLVAMVQIVNAYIAQGDLKRAATANERAKRFYESLPADAWADPHLPMGRDEWQRWLDSLAVLSPSGVEAGSNTPKRTTEAPTGGGPGGR